MLTVLLCWSVSSQQQKEPENNEDMKSSSQYQQQSVMEKIAQVNIMSSHDHCESCQLAFRLCPPTLAHISPCPSARATLSCSQSGGMRMPVYASGSLRWLVLRLQCSFLIPAWLAHSSDPGSDSTFSEKPPLIITGKVATIPQQTPSKV